ncbi:NAD(P)-binding protein [Crassisporium funariophilum]|nr:NAD(P)-binding protein [Crassisporium funariophilum]
MKLVITGCNGNVGRRVVKLALERGNTVLGIDLARRPDPQDEWTKNPEYTFKEADLRDFDVVLHLLEGYEAVINLAAFPNPTDYMVKSHNSNIVISWNVLRACAELGIERVAQASSVNVITMVYSKACNFHYFPIDEDHPCEPDEPYGLSKVICEAQADTIVRRYKSMRVASLRLHWSIPHRSMASNKDERRFKDLWGYVQQDSGADAFLLAVAESDKWSGHERFFIVAPQTATETDTQSLIEKYWPGVPIKEGKTISGTQSLFDCSKATALLGWHHHDPDS